MGTVFRYIGEGLAAPLPAAIAQRWRRHSGVVIKLDEQFSISEKISLDSSILGVRRVSTSASACAG